MHLAKRYSSEKNKRNSIDSNCYSVGHKGSLLFEQKHLTHDSSSLHQIEQFKFQYRTFYIICLTLNASLGSFNVGWNFGVLDTIQINLAEIFKWSSDDKIFYLSFISSAVPIGAAFGSFFAGLIAAKIGRRYSFILYDLISLVGITLTLFLNEYLMITGRFISGFCVGGYSAVVSIYVSEFVPYDISGACGATYECTFCFGVFLSYVFGLNLPPIQDVDNQWWRMMIAFPGCIALLNMFFLFVLFRHDTPRYLYMKRKDIKSCKECLDSIYKREIDKDQILNDYQDLSLVQNSEVGMLQLFGKKYRFRLFISSVLLIAQQTCGIDALLMYSDAIFLENISDRKMATLYTNLIGLSQVSSGFCAIFVIEKLGRKTLVTIGLFFISAILFSISLCYYLDNFDPVIYLFISFTFANGMSLSPISFVYAPDVLPENGVAFGMMLNYVTSFIITQSFLFLKNSVLKITGTLLIYASTTVITLIISMICLKETKGLSASAIDELFENTVKISDKKNKFYN